MRRLLSILRQPVPRETRQLLAERWAELPEELRLGWQVVGQHYVHCGYTLGPSYCSFGCTHCYLPKSANRVPLPPYEEMVAQIDANRRLMGPGRGLQITGGDVVDAYWRSGRADELVRLIRHADEVGVVPMLMTHGQVLLENPGYLARLVREGGLRKLAIHIDMTMAGRPGYPVASLRREADLHPLRQAFVDLILAVRRQTGIRFHAGHTVTVAERNLGSIGDIVTWLLGERRRLDAFKILSFQTEAAVGRTRFSARPATPEAVWGRICAAVGQDLPRDGLLFGHPDCSSVANLLVVYPEGRVLPVFPGEPEDRAFVTSVLGTFGGVGSRRGSFPESALRHLLLAARRPAIVGRVLAYAAHRRRDGLGVGFLRRLVTGRVRGLSIVMHSFMGRPEIEAGGETVDERLQACAFRGAVRRGDGWEAVPMCRMNAVEREGIYAELRPEIPRA